MDSTNARRMAMERMVTNTQPVVEEATDPLSRMLGPEKSTAFFKLLQKLFQPLGQTHRSGKSLEDVVFPFKKWDAEQKR